VLDIWEIRNESPTLSIWDYANIDVGNDTFEHSRCGASKNKPFCDGTHGTIGFSSENKVTATASDNDKKNIIKDTRKSYVGKKITIHDNRKICSHAAECVNNSPSVFKIHYKQLIQFGAQFKAANRLHYYVAP
jgi:CDGSH-type Zn-finger protein